MDSEQRIFEVKRAIAGPQELIAPAKIERAADTDLSNSENQEIIP
jgi:hypothetical protein